MPARPHSPPLLATAAGIAQLAGGCGLTESTSASAPSSSGGKQAQLVSITIDNTGCAVSPSKIQAGPVQFSVKNTHATRAQAKILFSRARYYYEQIEPVAESFGDLDPRIDGRIDDAATPADFIGFHRVEQALWTRGSTAGMTPIAAGLSTDVARLKTLVATVALQPAQIANGATELMDEVETSKITGEEDR